MTNELKDYEAKCQHTLKDLKSVLKIWSKPKERVVGNSKVSHTRGMSKLLSILL